MAASLILLTADDARSQELIPTVNWNVAGPAGFSDGGNWDTGSAPGADEGVVIGNGGTATVNSILDPGCVFAVVRDGMLTIDAGGGLTIEHETVVGGGSQIAISGSLTTGRLDSFGTVQLNSTGNLSVGGNFNNAGTLALNTTGSNPYAVANVGGHTNLTGGTIDMVTTPAGASFDVGNSWAFLQSGSIEGQPADITVGGRAPNLARGLDLHVVTNAEGLSSITVESVPVLTVDRLTGNLTMSNVGGGSMDIFAYSIGSEKGKLSGRNWISLADQDIPGWDEATPPTAFHLTEYNFEGSVSLTPGSPLNLGPGYAGIGDKPSAEDLTFGYVLTDGRVLDGIVEYTGAPNDLVLNIDPGTGAATLQNLSTLFETEIASYAILSESGSLVPGNLAGLGDGWVNANPQATALSELNLTGSKPFSQGTTAELGNIFDPNGAQDLLLQYSTVAGSVLAGTVQYRAPIVEVCAPINSLLGDLDGNGSVGFPDFLTLSANFGQDVNVYSAGDIDCNGNVGFPDFLTLSANFGQTLNGAAAAVPEPSTALLTLLGLCGLFAAPRRTRKLPMLVALLAFGLAASSQQAKAVDFDQRFIRLHPAGVNNAINNTLEAIQILDGTSVGVVLNENLTGKADILDFAGGTGSFSGIDNPYLNGVNDSSMSNFLTYVSGVLEIPEGDWTLGFGSDDGGFIRLSNVNFTTTFNENGPQTAGDGEIFFNGGRGHAWTAGQFTVPAGGVVTNFEAMFFEGGGGDSFEVAILDDFATNDALALDGFELEDGVFGVAVLDQPPLVVETVLGDFNGDGVVDSADESILDRNFASGTTLAQGDITGDGKVDLFDVSLFATVYPPDAAGAATAAVPEPGSLWLALLSATVLLRVTRRRAVR